jgi:hypothetical protein
MLYSDTSNVACGDYSVEAMNKIVNKIWSENEKSEISTWREMKVIEQTLITFKDVYKHKNIK